ncbi:hypothetical protein PV326_000966 [Microctonus aethiopoides]|nr:hypothetical protein PV326_000966 [Microctonus aethiopoides]
MSSRSAAVPGAFTLSMFSAALEIPGGYSLEVDRVGEYSIVFTAAFIVRLYWRELKVIPSERRGTCSLYASIASVMGSGKGKPPPFRSLKSIYRNKVRVYSVAQRQSLRL